jgi:hypothetical protein
VVVAKGMLSIVALGVALTARQRQLRPTAVAATPVWFLTAFLSVTMFGAWVSGLTLVSAIIVVRIVLLALVVFFFVRTYGYQRAVECWLTAMAVLAVVAAVTGLPSLASGRLGGGVPPIHPNELATLCVVPSIGLIWRIFQDHSRTIHVVLLVTLLGITWATGSRTSLAGTLVGALIVVGLTRRFTPVQAVVASLAAGAFAYVVFGTTIVRSFFLRGGSENVTSFASRSIGWSAALNYSDSDWLRWMGSGIALREVPVQGQYWATQVMESSWVSALVQTGRLGVIILAVWVVWIAASMRLIPRPQRILAIALFTALLLRSVTESGLVDSTTVFVTFWLLSLSCATFTAKRWQQAASGRGPERPRHSVRDGDPSRHGAGVGRPRG